MVNPTSSDAVLEIDGASISNTTMTTTAPIKVEEMDVDGSYQCDSKLVDVQEEVKVKKEPGVEYGVEPMKEEEPGAQDVKPLPKLVLRFRQPATSVKSDQDASGQ